MKQTILFSTLLLLSSIGCSYGKQNWEQHAEKVAVSQLTATARKMEHSTLLPASIYTSKTLSFLSWQLGRDSSSVSKQANIYKPEQIGKRRDCDIYDWTSGFFPGSLWYAYELTGDKSIAKEAALFTNRLYPIRLYTKTHDVGFMIESSYGNALRLMPNDSIEKVIIQTADNLCRRFDPLIGCLRSWDFGSWNFPVIIDNMMNLELLFHAWHLTGDKRYYDIAVTHALTTMKHHFRKDYTCYHVVSYNNDGSVQSQGTFQGRNDASAWARGQAWAAYGYEQVYEETHDQLFLNQAVHVADMIMERVKTQDKIPYWDYDAPVSKETPRDAAAAAVTASAFLSLSKQVSHGEKYFLYAKTILLSLSSGKYLAEPGSNYGFILKHSTGSLPHNSAVDSPLNYADYYYLEALIKYKKIGTMR